MSLRQYSAEISQLRYMEREQIFRNMRLGVHFIEHDILRGFDVLSHHVRRLKPQ